MSDDIIAKATRLIMDPAFPVSKAVIVLELVKAARETALEDAAKVIGVKLFNRSCTCGFEVAAAIRALKEET